MRSETQLDILLADPHLAPELKNIAQKVKNSERITFDEGVLLFEKGELGYLGTLANYIREKKMAIIPTSIAIFILSPPIFVCMIVNSALTRV